MSLRTPHVANAIVLLAYSALAACAAPPPPAPAPPPAVKQEAPPAPPPAPEPPPITSAEAPPPSAPESTAPKSSGRPPLLKVDPEEISDTFGSSPPAKLELGEQEKAILRIPENAFSNGVNVTFKIDKKGKSGGAQVGRIYRITPVVPPAATPSKVPTAGPAFELALPAGNKKEANLAIGEIVTDDKGKEKLVWTVVAPTKIEDATGTAHFELPWLSDAYLHVTTKPVSAPKP
jgi:hypothetical protein